MIKEEQIKKKGRLKGGKGREKKGEGRKEGIRVKETKDIKQKRQKKEHLVMISCSCHLI